MGVHDVFKVWCGGTIAVKYVFKIDCHQIVRYFGDACQSPKRERSGLRDR